VSVNFIDRRYRLKTQLTRESCSVLMDCEQVGFGGCFAQAQGTGFPHASGTAFRGEVLANR